MENREYLVHLVVKYEGNWKKIHEAVLRREEVEPMVVKEKYLTILDEEYPSCLKELENPPWVLFYRGDPALLQRPKVTIVGSREMGEYGRVTTGITADILKEKMVIVSGLAKGVDAQAHKHALQGGKTIAVVGHGLDIQYPAVNKRLYEQIEKHGLLLSEFPDGTPIRKSHFPWRNRILAALGDIVIVTQAGIKSGTMHTVNAALELGKEIYCIPYPFASAEGELCSQLIKEGAGILYDMQQIEEIVTSLEKFSSVEKAI